MKSFLSAYDAFVRICVRGLLQYNLTKKMMKKNAQINSKACVGYINI